MRARIGQRRRGLRVLLTAPSYLAVAMTIYVGVFLGLGRITNVGPYFPPSSGPSGLFWLDNDDIDNHMLAVVFWPLVRLLEAVHPGTEFLWRPSLQFSRPRPGRGFARFTGRVVLNAVPAAVWMPVIAGLLAAWLYVIADQWMRWTRPTRMGRCASCGYNLKGNVSGVCPECGTSVPAPDRSAGVNDKTKRDNAP